MLLNHLIFFSCWILFYALHSLLAANQTKSKIGLKPKTYRLIYSLFSTLGLGFILILGASTYSFFLFPPLPAMLYVGLVLATFGLFVIKRAFRNYSFKVFIGLEQESPENQALKKDSLQSKIRHPLYTGTLMLFLGYFIYNPLLINFLSLVALIIYLPIGIRLEEKKLIEQFGKEYLDYKKSTPALFPRFKRP